MCQFTFRLLITPFYYWETQTKGKLFEVQKKTLKKVIHSGATYCNSGLKAGTENKFSIYNFLICNNVVNS